ncbi:MAG: iron ABC transporter permease [Gudongella sp.]|nr:iron ABC transporter permease [Gudongella sp.]
MTMTGDSAGYSIYSAIVKRRRTVLATMALASLLLFLLCVATGPMRYSLADVIRTVLNPDSVSGLMRSVIWDYRLPEAALAVVVGASLGMAGAEMQTILDNPLAEPYTLGISTAAAFGASLCIVFGLGAGILGDYALPAVAFAFALATCLVIYAVARLRSSDKQTIILMGIAMLFLFQSLVSLMQVTTSKEAASAVMFWMFGSLGKADWENVAIVGTVALLAGVLFALNFWKLTSLRLGDPKASSLGVDVGRIRRNILITVSLLTATAVSFTGTIGFVGLVGPHISRMLVGEDQRFFLPVSALAGAMLLCAALFATKAFDLVSSLPIGIITSLIGVPFLIIMILRRREATL